MLAFDDYQMGEILIVPKSIEYRPRTNGEIVFYLLFVTIATIARQLLKETIIFITPQYKY